MDRTALVEVDLVTTNSEYEFGAVGEVRIFIRAHSTRACDDFMDVIDF